MLLRGTGGFVQKQWRLGYKSSDPHQRQQLQRPGCRRRDCEQERPGCQQRECEQDQTGHADRSDHVIGFRNMWMQNKEMKNILNLLKEQYFYK